MQNKRLIRWSFVVALAGFLFGFDTAVISGADQPIQNLWGLSDLFHGVVIMSMALWGTVIGAIFGNIPTDKYGRKRTLFWIGVLFLLSALGSALATDPYTFSFFRFIGGLGVGCSSVTAPIYISEIAPARSRGRLVALYQFNIVFGILIAYLSNYFLGSLGGNAWRYMLAVEAVPALVYCLMVVGIPNSPRWLVLRKNALVQARAILQQLDPGSDVEKTIKEIKYADSHDTEEKLLTRTYRFPIILAFLLAFFNQLSGINFVIYYSPRIFEAAGIGADNALLSTAGIGLVNLIATLIGMYLIDRSGRKNLLIIGSVGYIISLALLSHSFYTQNFGGAAVPIYAFLFIASHAVGQGAIIWVYISEIFPTVVRAKGQSLGTSTHWVFAALITLFMPYVLNRFSGGPIFAFYSGMMVLQLLFALFIMPETKGVPLEELEKKLIKRS